MNLGGLRFFYTDITSTARPPVPLDIPPTATDLIIIRHGETAWNRERRIQGQLDAALNEIGRIQARAVANRLASFSVPFAAIYSSDLSRASDTARAIALSIGHTEVIEEPGLRERHAGVVQGLTTAEAEQKHPAALRSFLSRDLNTQVEGGGESLKMLSDRVVQCIKKISQKHKGERVVLVSHGGAMVTMHQHITGRKPSESILNTSINVVRACDVRGWDVIAWGVVDHIPDHGKKQITFGGSANSA